MKTAAIVQSSYIPWKGHFDLVNWADEFILLDEVQYTRRDWRNRNAIKTPEGTQWLTIPVKAKGRFDQRIDAVEVSDPAWAAGHWRAVRQNYARAEYFDAYAAQLEELWLGCEATRLSEVNRRFLEALCDLLHIGTPISWSTDHDHSAGDATDRLLSLCRAVGAEEYLSGPSARDYLDAGRFEDAGIAVRFADYEGYPEYRQLHPPFRHEVSVIDLLLNEGPDARRYMKSFG